MESVDKYCFCTLWSHCDPYGESAFSQENCSLNISNVTIRHFLPLKNMTFVNKRLHSPCLVALLCLPQFFFVPVRSNYSELRTDSEPNRYQRGGWCSVFLTSATQSRQRSFLGRRNQPVLSLHVHRYASSLSSEVIFGNWQRLCEHSLSLKLLI